MKVLYIIPSLGKGGAERYALDLCINLNARAGVEYKLAILGGKNDYKFLTPEVNCERLDGPFVPSIFRKSDVNVEQYKNLLERFNPDIVHTHLFSAEIFTSIFVPKNVAFVVHGHDNMIQFENLSMSILRSKIRLTNYYEKQLLIWRKYRANRNIYFIANSQNTLEYFQRTLPEFLVKNVRLIECGFDYKRFYRELRCSKFIDGKFNIINVGSFVEKKNQAFIVDIASVLRKRGFDFTINMLGDGELLEATRDKIQKLRLEDNVFLRGNVDFVERWLSNSDLYLHTAYYEPFGLVLLEAMASGLPCVILDGKGNRNIIKNDFNGYLFQKPDAEEFANKIIELAHQPEKMARLSQNAQNFARTYDISDKTDELLDFYNSIALRNT